MESLSNLLRYHVATTPELPPAKPGIEWIWAANGIFKRGVAYGLDLCIPVAVAWPTPGLAAIQPSHRWQQLRSQRLPGDLLHGVYAHAQQRAGIEQQYFVCYLPSRFSDRPIRVITPPQDATASAVRYAMPNPASILLDIHSHHDMSAYFSETDNRDDTGLSISVVIGTLNSRPTICCRLNVYGHHYRYPASLLFTHLGPFVEVHPWS